MSLSNYLLLPSPFAFRCRSGRSLGRSFFFFFFPPFFFGLLSPERKKGRKKLERSLLFSPWNRLWRQRGWPEGGREEREGPCQTDGRRRKNVPPRSEIYSAHNGPPPPPLLYRGGGCGDGGRDGSLFDRGRGAPEGGSTGRGADVSPAFFLSEAAAAKLSAEIKLSHAKLNKKFIPPLGAMSDSLFGVPSLPPCMDNRARRRPRIFKPRMAQRTRQTVRRSPLYVVGVAGGANWLSENFSSSARHSNPVFTAIRSRGPQTFSSQLPPARRFSAQKASPQPRRHRTAPLLFLKSSPPVEM